jgi:hypothetical protein
VHYFLEIRIEYEMLLPMVPLMPLNCNEMQLMYCYYPSMAGGTVS